MAVPHFLVIRASPTPVADPEGRIAQGIVHVWILESDPMRAQEAARTAITESDWTVDAIMHHFQPTPEQITQLHEDEQRSAKRAMRFGVSTEFIAWPKVAPSLGGSEPAGGTPDGFTVSDRLWRKQQASISRVQAAVRQRFSAKHCLHPAASLATCHGGIARAHSVQRSSLQKIAQEGHVYRLSADIRVLHQTGGLPSAELIGINKASTFTGLCAHHDNHTFSPLEKEPFRGDAQQCALLAYRAVLREVYVKRLAALPLDAFAESINAQSPAARPYLQHFHDAYILGTQRGRKAIESHKDDFDSMVRTSDFSAIRSVVVRFRLVPSVMVSTGWFPTSDFDGHFMPNLALLGREDCRPDLITLSVFATETGGAAVLAWHNSSDATSDRFSASLARQVGDLTNHIVCLAFQTSENIYLRPPWWESLPQHTQQHLLGRLARGANPAEPFTAEDLVANDLEVGSWQAESITIRVTTGGRVLECRELI